MQKKRSISQNKSTKKKVIPKKKICEFCLLSSGLIMVIQNALYRKYSSINIYQSLQINKYMKETKSQKIQIKQQHMQKYYKTVHRRHQFKKIKQIYKLSRQSPRLFMPDIHEIINKCHHKKKLLQYFRIAKVLGIRVEAVKFSTFLLSLSRSHLPMGQKKQPYDRVIGQISGYEFSEDVERQLIETLESKQNNMNAGNSNIKNHIYYKTRQQETASSLHNTHFRLQ